MRDEPLEDWGLSVEPIRRIEDIQAIKARLADRPRDLLLFSLGINNGLRAGDLLRICVNQVRHLEPGERASVRVKRTGDLALLTVPALAYQALQEHLRSLDPPAPPGDMYLFAGQRGWTPLTTERLNAMVAEWTRAVGLEGHYGAETLRKTFGYIQRTRFGVDLAILSTRFGHASAAVTQRYLGLNGGLLEDVVLAEI